MRLRPPPPPSGRIPFFSADGAPVFPAAMSTSAPRKTGLYVLAMSGFLKKPLNISA